MTCPRVSWHSPERQPGPWLRGWTPGPNLLGLTPSSAVNQLCKGAEYCLLQENSHVVFYPEGSEIFPVVSDTYSVC